MYILHSKCKFTFDVYIVGSVLARVVGSTIEKHNTAIQTEW